MKKKITLLVAVIGCGIHFSLYSQETGATVEFGLGRTAFEETATFTGPLNGDLASFYRFGITLRRTPARGDFFYTTGLLYNTRQEGLQHLLQVPLEFHFFTGQRLKLILGGGVYGRYLLSYDNKSELGWTSGIHYWQFGCSVDAGLGFPLTERLELDVVFKQNFDLTPLYSTNYRTVTDLKGYDGFFSFSLYYQLFSENQEKQ